MLDAPFVELSFVLPPHSVHPAVTLLGGVVPNGTPIGHDNVITIDVPDVIGISRGTERIAFDGHSLSLLGEAQDIEAEMAGGLPPHHPRARRARTRIYTKMLEVASRIDFVYGAILIEEPLDKLGELISNDGGSYAFRDFVLRDKCFPSRCIEKILRIAPNAYAERFAAGTYISLTPGMNPEGKGGSSTEGVEHSLAISKVVANYLRQGCNE